MVSPISGVFNTTNLGAAIASVGDDVARNARAQENRDWKTQLEKMEFEYKKQLFELKTALGGGAKAPAAGDMPIGGDYALDASGLTKPEFEEATDFINNGPKTAREADMSMRGMTGGLDEQDIPTVVRQTPSSERGQKNADRVRHGRRAAAVGPENQETFEKAQTERVKRDGAFSSDDNVVERTRIGARAMDGKDRYGVQGDEKIDQNSGFKGQTDQGKSKIRENDAKAGEHTASAGQKRRGEDTNTRIERRDIENAITQTQRDLRSYNQDPSFMRKVKANPGSAEAREYDALGARLERLNRELRQLPGRQPDRNSPGGQTPKGDKDQFEVGKVYRDSKGRRAKYLGNGNWQPV